ncbi:YwmB family TATA-box binding protein [Alkaliphilus transvaalensis]|uniref:YwmB family TATA-box binding protein n=1 Tax=Alkaliphilus transvaalensis TaxID=114628 RepID=UPI0004786821|nr:YwmB family TATA-box binding protein [Alkaliphilus transvaalensis]
MKRLFTIGIVLILLWGLIDSSSGFIKGTKEVFNSEADLLVKGFEASKAEFQELNINSTLHLPNIFFSMEEMEEIKETLIERLSLEGEIKVVTEGEHYDPYFMPEDDLTKDTIFLYINQEEGYNQITATAVDVRGKLTVFIIYSMGTQNQKESYIIIDMVQNKGYKEIEEIIEQHKEILVEFGEDIETHSTLVGTIGGQIAGNSKTKWLDSIAKAVNAHKVEEVTDDSYISITLFSKDISRAIQYGNSRVNLQLASRYNQYEDKTYLWIATPLITNTY